jgi:hypothetical protein
VRCACASLLFILELQTRPTKQTNAQTLGYSSLQQKHKSTPKPKKTPKQTNKNRNTHKKTKNTTNPSPTTTRPKKPKPGGRYDLKLSASSDDAPLHPGVIVVSLGARYASYCANVGRTYLINPSKVMEAQYGALLAAHDAAVAALVDGAPCSAPYDAAVAALREKGHPELAERLPKSVGFGMGLEFKESGTALGARGAGTTARAGMVFNVSLGVAGLENDAAGGDARAKTYALQVSDTVAVKPGGAAPDVLTALCPKDWASVSYTLNEKVCVMCCCFFGAASSDCMVVVMLLRCCLRVALLPSLKTPPLKNYNKKHAHA